MLHIKLPKGKVSIACEHAADQCSQYIATANDRYCSELERWHKRGGGPPIWLVQSHDNDVEVLIEERYRLHQMADMANHSTGNVYVSPELWNLIKGVY